MSQNWYNLHVWRDSGNNFRFPDIVLYTCRFRLVFVCISSGVSFWAYIRQVSLFVICHMFLCKINLVIWKCVQHIGLLIIFFYLVPALLWIATTYFYIWTIVTPLRDSIHLALGLNNLLNEKVDDIDHQATTAGFNNGLFALH